MQPKESVHVSGVSGIFAADALGLCQAVVLQNQLNPSKGHSMREVSEVYAINNGSPTSRFSIRPLYLQVRDAIAQRIADGEWKPHTVIPNESELAREFGVSPGTMRKALDLAEAERLLTRRQGRGTFVNDQSSDEHAARYDNIRARDGQRIDCQISVLSGFEATIGERDGARLRLQPRERVYCIRRVWSVDGKPYILEDTVIPVKLFPHFSIHEDASRRIATLAQQFGVLLGGSEERITLKNASTDAATALRIADGTPVMRIDRTIYTLQGAPAEWSLAQCLMDDGRFYFTQLR
jgi:GntR family transcriptional regulator